MATIDEMAETFYGFGRWDAPFWFLGPEQGMAKAGDGLETRCECWDKMGRGELVDCIAYHRCLGYTRFHEPPYRLQPTWQKLIKLLLTFEGEIPHQHKVRDYQATGWGTSGNNGETCVIDLSALAAPNLKTLRDRESFREHRIAVLRNKIETHKPTFVVMYGLTTKAQFEKVADGRFGSDGFCDWLHRNHANSGSNGVWVQRR